MAEREQVAGGQMAAAEVVEDDAVQIAALKIAADEHAGRAVAAQKLHALHALLRGTEKDAVHVAREGGGDSAELLFAVFLAV